MDGEQELAKVDDLSVDRKAIDDWFFNHFHQEAFINNEVVFRMAGAARDDLLKLLGLN